jgi:hypothetical protein
MRLIQQGARRRHLRVCKHGIPTGFLLLEPSPHMRAIGCSSRGGDMVDKMAQSLAQRKHAQALALACPVPQRVELGA